MSRLPSLGLRQWPSQAVFLFRLPFWQFLPELHFDIPVTRIVGENGSGKPTLLEGLACAAERIVVDGESTHRNPEAFLRKL